MEVSDLRRMKEMEQELHQLKRMYTKRPPEKREAAMYLIAE